MSEGSCWRALGFFVRSTVSIHFVIHFIPFPFWLNVRLRVSLSLASFSRMTLTLSTRILMKKLFLPV